MTAATFAARPNLSGVPAGPDGSGALPLRRVEPAHQLTLMSDGHGRVRGRCRCGQWDADGATSDIVGAYFEAHLRCSPGPSLVSCDVCQQGVAQVREGIAVEVCGSCALDTDREVDT